MAAPSLIEIARGKVEFSAFIWELKVRLGENVMIMQFFFFEFHENLDNSTKDRIQCIDAFFAISMYSC